MPAAADHCQMRRQVKHHPKEKKKRCGVRAWARGRKAELWSSPLNCLRLQPENPGGQRHDAVGQDALNQPPSERLICLHRHQEVEWDRRYLICQKLMSVWQDLMESVGINEEITLTPHRQTVVLCI